MKFFPKILIVFFLATCCFSSQAQTKLGHVNAQKVVEMMPAYKEAEKKLQAYVMQLKTQFEKMQQELATKVTAFEKDAPTLSEPIKEVRLQEIKDAETRIMEMQGASEQDAYKKQAELLKPLEEQVMTAIKAVATEKGYSYIFDSSGGVMLYGPPSDDIFNLVKAKLGIL